MSPTQTNQEGTHRPLTTVGRFVVHEILGAGAAGQVYLASDPVLERRVALKIPRFADGDPQRHERFIREAKAAGRLRHPAIVAVLEGGHAGDESYIASEFVEGTSLATWLTDQRPSYVQAVAWVQQIAAALDYAHGEGVVHRDVKPGNLMIDAAGRPRLMDFGLAKQLTEESGLTTEGTLLGTPAYMSPEQARGSSHDTGPLSDQYSLGVVFYELLTGRIPFDGPPHVVIPRVIHEAPVAPRQINGRIPRDLEVICLKSLAKAPSDRYLTCGEFGEDLGRWLRGEPIAARRTPAVELAWRWARRHRLAAALSAAVILLLLGFASISSFATLSLARDRAAMESALVESTRQREQEQDQERLAHDRLRVAEEQSRRAELHARHALEAERQVADALKSLQGEETRLNELRSRRDSAVESTAESDANTESTAEMARRAAQELQESRDKLKTADSLAHYLNTLELVTAAIDAGQPAQSLALLDECDQQHRGWEWRYLRGRCRGYAPGGWTAVDARVKLAAAPGRHCKYACFSPNGRWLACLAGGERIQLLNAETGARTDTLQFTNHRPDNSQDEVFFDLDISPDNQHLAALSERLVVIWDLTTGSVVASHFRPQWDNLVLGYRPNGQLLVVSCESSPGGQSAPGKKPAHTAFHLSVWDGKTGSKSNRISAVGQGILTRVDDLNVTFAAREGQLLAHCRNFALAGTRFNGERLVRMDLTSGVCDLPTFVKWPFDISTAHDPAGKRMLTDQGIQDVATLKTVLPLAWLLKDAELPTDGQPRTYAWSPDDDRIAVQIRESIRVVSLPSETERTDDGR